MRLNNPWLHGKGWVMIDTPVKPQADEATFLCEEAHNTALIFNDGAFSPQSAYNLPDGVLIVSLDSAAAAPLRSRYTPLLEDINNNGALIYVPAGIVLSSPVQITVTGSMQAASLRNILILEPHAQATVVMLCTDSANAAYTHLVETDLILEPGAQLNYSHIQTEGEKARHHATTRVFLKADAHCVMTSVALGSLVANHTINVQLLENGAHASLNGLSVLDGEAQATDITTIEHIAPHCTSQQCYKGILDGSSRSHFDGTIIIKPNAQQTSAQQMNRNLLLSDKARVTTQPQLRIDADDVKCTHGATVGQLSDDELFYLASRGISPQEARSMLTLGFAGSIINDIPVPSLRAHLTGLIKKKLTPSPHPVTQ